MRKLLLLFGVIVVSYTAWTITYPPASWRYRLTLEIETPEGMKTGSSVIEVQVKDGPSFNPDGARTVFVHGEAVAVDLGLRGMLFALLSNERSADYPIYVVFETFPWPGGPGGQITKSGRAFYQALKGKAELPIDKLPMLVRFRDINDPKTVERVDPSDLAASFGAGVKLVRTTIEMTKAPVTAEIVGKLVWLSSLKGTLSGKIFADPANPGRENYITAFDFKRETPK